MVWEDSCHEIQVLPIPVFRRFFLSGYNGFMIVMMLNC